MPIDLSSTAAAQTKSPNAQTQLLATTNKAYDQPLQQQNIPLTTNKTKTKAGLPTTLKPPVAAAATTIAPDKTIITVEALVKKPPASSSAVVAGEAGRSNTNNRDGATTKTTVAVNVNATATAASRNARQQMLYGQFRENHLRQLMNASNTASTTRRRSPVSSTASLLPAVATADLTTAPQARAVAEGGRMAAAAAAANIAIMGTPAVTGPGQQQYHTRPSRSHGESLSKHHYQHASRAAARLKRGPSGHNAMQMLQQQQQYQQLHVNRLGGEPHTVANTDTGSQHAVTGRYSRTRLHQGHHHHHAASKDSRSRRWKIRIQMGQDKVQRENIRLFKRLQQIHNKPSKANRYSGHHHGSSHSDSVMAHHPYTSPRRPRARSAGVCAQGATGAASVGTAVRTETSGEAGIGNDRITVGDDVASPSEKSFRPFSQPLTNHSFIQPHNKKRSLVQVRAQQQTATPSPGQKLSQDKKHSPQHRSKIKVASPRRRKYQPISNSSSATPRYGRSRNGGGYSPPPILPPMASSSPSGSGGGGSGDSDGVSKSSCVQRGSSDLSGSGKHITAGASAASRSVPGKRRRLSFSTSSNSSAGSNDGGGHETCTHGRDSPVGVTAAMSPRKRAHHLQSHAKRNSPVLTTSPRKHAASGGLESTRKTNGATNHGTKGSPYLPPASTMRFTRSRSRRTSTRIVSSVLSPAKKEGGNHGLIPSLARRRSSSITKTPKSRSKLGVGNGDLSLVKEARGSRSSGTSSTNGAVARTSGGVSSALIAELFGTLSCFPFLQHRSVRHRSRLVDRIVAENSRSSMVGVDDSESELEEQSCSRHRGRSGSHNKLPSLPISVHIKLFCLEEIMGRDDVATLCTDFESLHRLLQKSLDDHIERRRSIQLWLNDRQQQATCYDSQSISSSRSGTSLACGRDAGVEWMRWLPSPLSLEAAQAEDGDVLRLFEQCRCCASNVVQTHLSDLCVSGVRFDSVDELLAAVKGAHAKSVAELKRSGGNTAKQGHLKKHASPALLPAIEAPPEALISGSVPIHSVAPKSDTEQKRRPSRLPALLLSRSHAFSFEEDAISAAATAASAKTDDASSERSGRLLKPLPPLQSKNKTLLKLESGICDFLLDPDHTPLDPEYVLIVPMDVQTLMEKCAEYPPPLLLPLLRDLYDGNESGRTAESTDLCKDLDALVELFRERAPVRDVMRLRERVAVMLGLDAELENEPSVASSSARASLLSRECCRQLLSEGSKACSATDSVISSLSMSFFRVVHHIRALAKRRQLPGAKPFASVAALREAVVTANKQYIATGAKMVRLSLKSLVNCKSSATNVSVSQLTISVSGEVAHAFGSSKCPSPQSQSRCSSLATGRQIATQASLYDLLDNEVCPEEVLAHLESLDISGRKFVSVDELANAIKELHARKRSEMSSYGHDTPMLLPKAPLSRGPSSPSLQEPVESAVSEPGPVALFPLAS